MKEELRQELVKTVNALPLEPPPGTLEEMKRRKLIGNVHNLLYRLEYVYDDPEWCFDDLIAKREKAVKVICTKCGFTHYFDYFKHQSSYGFIKYPGYDIYDGDMTVCPACDTEMTAIRSTSFKGEKQLESKHILTVKNVLGHLCLISWWCNVTTDRDGIVTAKFHRHEAAILIGKKLCRATGFIPMFYSSTYGDKWQERLVYRDEIKGVNKNEIMPFDAGEVFGSDGGKTAIERYLYDCDRCYPAKYLQLWTSHPNVENLVRRGLSPLISDIIRDCTVIVGSYYSTSESLSMRDTANYIDWKKKKPHEMLRVEKNDIDHAASLGVPLLKLYVTLKKQGVTIDDKNLRKLEEKANDIGSLFDEFEKLPAEHTINYILKLKDPFRLYYLRDYYSMVVNVYDELLPELMFPKNLKLAHDRMIRLQKEVSDKKRDERISKRAAELEKYRFEADGLEIIPPLCEQDFVNEGKKLNHCVARYADQHAQGKTTILFIRHTDKPKDPFYTLEWNNGKIVQDHGKNNKLQTPEILAFEEKWLNYIRGGLSNGKRSAV